MEEVKIDKGILKFNRNMAIITSTAYVLMGIGFAATNIADNETISCISGGLLCVWATFPAKIAYDNNKVLKKNKK